MFVFYKTNKKKFKKKIGQHIKSIDMLAQVYIVNYQILFYSVKNKTRFPTDRQE